MKWTVFFVVMLILLLPQPLLFSYTQSLDDRSVKLVKSTNYGLASANGYINVNVSEAKQMIESNPDLVILDVRTVEEYNEGHIEDAVLIPVSELEVRLDELDSEKDTLVYCRSGVRSATASQILVDNGFSSVYNVLGGITAWRTAGYWIEIIHRGDLIIDGTQTYVIENCTYIQTGNIIVKDYGRLKVKNTLLTMKMDYWQQYEIYAKDHSVLEIESGEVTTEQPDIHISAWEYAKIKLNSSKMERVCIFGRSQIDIAYSFIGELRVLQPSKVTLLNSQVSLLHPEFDQYSAGNIDYLKPGFYEYWNLRQNGTLTNVQSDLTLKKTTVNAWALTLNYKSRIIVSKSTIDWSELDFHEISAHIKDLKPGFYENLNLSSLIFRNCSINSWTARIFEDAIVTIEKSTIGLFFAGNSKCFVSDSQIRCLDTYYFFGKIHFNETIMTNWVAIRDSQFFVTGNLKVGKVEIWVWASSNVVRNYEVTVRDSYENLVSNASLILKSKDAILIWNGSTNLQGRANFNLTFTDGNYTDTLRLEAVKGDYSAAMNVSFLSDTPIILTMRYFTDLNGDGTINIQDIFIVAKAFGTKERDENYNPIADLDANKEINIIDLYKVATEYGKTV